MKLSQFRFDLPLNLIAQNPAKRREDARMMVVHRHTGQIENKHFRDIMDYFDDKDVFVVNNTKVFPARMYGRKEKTGAKIEVFLLRELNKPNRLWDVIVDPARKIRVGNKLYFGDNEELVAEVIDNTTSRGRTIRFLWEDSEESFRGMLEKLGETPYRNILSVNRMKKIRNVIKQFMQNMKAPLQHQQLVCILAVS
jgi:S-adenosylmethionine:tRNA ribosyltransferase-isomerase